ncbi:MAG TPA: DNA internalization-related competence protein ComEC/Rec2, partial [Legionellaceae bacterium]|nr:DNA internalization-related competence protein ComEC/Rec2 [Legionellaceae bacterium]
PMSIWQTWRYALFLVLMLEPHSVLMLGFYFSFIAMAILILVSQRIRLGKVNKMFALQLACLLGLMPLNLYWFSYGSLNGLLANLFAIPLVSFLIVPLALLITFLSPWFVIPGSITLINWLIMHFLIGIQWVDSFNFLNFNFTFTNALSPLALLLAMVILTLLPIKQLFPIASLFLIIGFFPHFETIKIGDAKMNVLDVGQGLAVVIKTTHHILLYDTGMKFFQGGDMGKMAIIPYLNTLGIKYLDTVVISHPDLDHRGGLSSIEEKYPMQELIVNNPQYYHRGKSCHHYPPWEWDGVTFRFFAITKVLSGKNNNSCILQISNKNGQIIISGDIEKKAEHYLIHQYGHRLHSSIMIIPHHGSKTSSSLAYIEHIAPRYAISSYGWNNRYHFPHQQALHNYQIHHIPIFNTVDCGMVQINLNNKQQPSCFRK